MTSLLVYCTCFKALKTVPATPLTIRSLFLLCSPLCIHTCFFLIPRDLDKKIHRALLALPSTGGALTEILSRPACMPRTSSLSAPGFNTTLKIQVSGSNLSRNCMQVSLYLISPCPRKGIINSSACNQDFCRNLSLDSASSRCRCSSSCDSSSFRCDSIMDLSLISK